MGRRGKMSIEVKNITKHFGTFQALDNVSLKIETGELVALLGPSGSGKTSLLRIIAGLETPDPVPGAHIRFHEEDVAGFTVGERRVGFVFQHYALFRHMSVFENVAFGLRVKPRKERPSKNVIEKRVHELLQLIQLDGLSSRYPHQLSGGQRQRVALARALAVEPKVLLLDEPFGALDAQVRKDLRAWLRRLHDEIHITSVFVTHDQEEALEVADRVVVMNQGRIEQVGSPSEVYHRPANPFVYSFLGDVNLFHSRTQEGKLLRARNHRGLLSTPESLEEDVFIRPHMLDITRERAEDAIRGRIEHINSAAPTVKLQIRSEWDSLVLVEISQERFREVRPKKEEEIYVVPKETALLEPEYMI
jgi:sulfate transport system ATP-binding protein